MGAEKEEWDVSTSSGSIADDLAKALSRNQEFELGSLDLDDFVDQEYFQSKDGKRFLVYIREQAGFFKYHLRMCQHLIDRQRKNTLTNRYVATAQKSNIFTITGSNFGSDVNRVKLDVCRYCLTEINWKHPEYGYFKRNDKRKKELIVDDFHPDTYFRSSEREEFDPGLEQDINVPYNQYSSMHGEIARLHKGRVNYTCQCNKCKIDLSEDSFREKYLHLHHINGRKDDYSTENLAVLCVSCHDNRHDHTVSPQVLRAFKDRYGSLLHPNCCEA